MRKIMLAGCVLWIIGLALTLIGLNVPGSSGSWMSVIGNILFFSGLFLVGLSWLLRRKQAEQEKRGEP